MAHIFTGNCFATVSDMAINYLKCYAVTTGAFVGEWDDLQAVLPGRPQCFVVFIKWSDLERWHSLQFAADSDKGGGNSTPA